MSEPTCPRGALRRDFLLRDFSTTSGSLQPTAAAGAVWLGSEATAAGLGSYPVVQSHPVPALDGGSTRVRRRQARGSLAESASDARLRVSTDMNAPPCHSATTLRIGSRVAVFCCIHASMPAKCPPGGDPLPLGAAASYIPSTSTAHSQMPLLVLTGSCPAARTALARGSRRSEGSRHCSLRRTYKRAVSTTRDITLAQK